MFWLKDSLGFIFQIALVIAGVLLFSYLDPFNLFNSKKLRLNPTSLIVESTQNIGELITAEYYGEVLATSEESFLISYENLQDSLKQQIKEADSLFVDIADEIGDMDDFPGSWGKKFDSLQKAYPEFFEHPGFHDYWEILKQTTNKNKDRYVLKAVVKGGNFKRTPNTKIDAYIKDTYKEFESKKEKRQIHDHQLVMLGRGWVKVGIDFANFDEGNLRYDKTHHKINLFRKRPEIISAAINPWLSPEKHIRGFEMLRVHSKIDDNAELVKKVKSLCLEKLIKQAEEAGIMEQAIKNAETNLSAFFSLILDETVTVDIFGHVLEAYLAEFATDNTITPTEMQAADSLVKKYYQQDMREAIKFYEAINELGKNKGIPSGLTAWNFRTLYLEIAADSVLSSYEKNITDSLSAQPPALADAFYYLMDKWGKEDTIKNARLHQLDAFQLRNEEDRKRKDESKESAFSALLIQLKDAQEYDSAAAVAFQQENIALFNTLILNLKQEEIPVAAIGSTAADPPN